MFEWDETKRERNKIQHKTDFAALDAFDFSHAAVIADNRHHYGEVRLQAIGFIGLRLYVLVYTIREERRKIRVISLRPANRKEARIYVALIG